MSKTLLLQAIHFSQTVLIKTIQLSIVFVHTHLNVKTVLFQTIHLSVKCPKQYQFKQFNFVLVRSLHVKTVLFQAIQFSISTQFTSIWSIDKIISGATISGNDGNEGVLRIPQNSSIAGTSPSDCLWSWHSFGGGVLPLRRDAVGVFYSPSQQGKRKSNMMIKWIEMCRRFSKKKSMCYCKFSNILKLII